MTKEIDAANVSPKQMKEIARTLWKARDIDLHQLGMLEMAGPLGKVGPNGEFIQFTAAEREALQNTPRNYIHLAKDAITGIESRGAATDPTVGYKDGNEIFDLLQIHPIFVAVIKMSA